MISETLLYFVAIVGGSCVVATDDTLTNVTATEIGDNASKIKVLEAQLAEQNRSIAQLKKVLERIGYSQTGEKAHVSFLAVHNKTQDVATGGVVQFPQVRHTAAPPNYGYDDKISFFRCPYTATYVFHANVVTGVYNNYYRVSLVKEGHILTSSYTLTHSASGNFKYHTLALSAVTPCQKGQDVWVKNTLTSTLTFYSDTQGSSHFTGYMLN